MLKLEQAWILVGVILSIPSFAEAYKPIPSRSTQKPQRLMDVNSVGAQSQASLPNSMSREHCLGANRLTRQAPDLAQTRLQNCSLSADMPARSARVEMRGLGGTASGSPLFDDAFKRSLRIPEIQTLTKQSALLQLQNAEPLRIGPGLIGSDISPKSSIWLDETIDKPKPKTKD